LTFDSLDLDDDLLRAVKDEGYTEPTPIQVAAIPEVLAGRDLLGIAQTGTGKTAAFALPVLQNLGQPPRGNRPIRVLVLAPTRELAAQIGQSFSSYGRHTRLTNTVIFGGVKQRSQVDALRRGIDVLVATPGRLLDLMGQGHVHLSDVEIFILDEADRMLDMGFVHDVRRVVAEVPTDRQTLLFSATMPNSIVKLSRSVLRDPVRVEVTPSATTAEKVRQAVLFVEKADKRKLLTVLLERPTIERALVFTRTKHGANRVVKHLDREGVSAAAIHGNKSQNAREKALGGFREGRVRVLVATDIAARGIDVEGVTHVVNFDLPNVSEQYVHRIGRTARAGASGMALSFCDREETGYLRDIEALIGEEISEVKTHPFKGEHDRRTPAVKPPKQERHGGRGGGGGGRGGGRRYGGGGPRR
jgi:ATP-dependent RNA helicase RhlE